MNEITRKVIFKEINGLKDYLTNCNCELRHLQDQTNEQQVIKIRLEDSIKGLEEALL